MEDAETHAFVHIATEIRDEGIGLPVGKGDLALYVVGSLSVVIEHTGQRGTVWNAVFPRTVSFKAIRLLGSCLLSVWVLRIELILKDIVGRHWKTQLLEDASELSVHKLPQNDPVIFSWAYLRLGRRNTL
jgi:hypothetical protein